MKQKLYRCELRLVYFALAEEEGEAALYVGDAVEDMARSDSVIVKEVDVRDESELDEMIGKYWTDKVYHSDQDYTVIPLMSAVQERT